MFRRGTEGRERGIIRETKIELRGSSAENVFVIATYRARRVYLEYSFPVSHHNTLLLHSDRTLLIVHNACTEGEGTRTAAWRRKMLTKIWELGMFSSFRSNSIFASTCNSINSSNPFAPLDVSTFASTLFARFYLNAAKCKAMAAMLGKVYRRGRCDYAR